MKYIAAVGAEIRFQGERERSGPHGPYIQEEGEVVMMYFLDRRINLHSAHIGRLFPADEDPLPYLRQALEAFPIDGNDLTVLRQRDGKGRRNLVYARGVTTPTEGDRGHSLRRTKLWTPSAGESEEEAELTGYVVGWGTTVEFSEKWFLVPWVSVRVPTPAGPRNIHARVRPPYSSENKLKSLAHTLRKKGELGELPSRCLELQEEWGQLGNFLEEVTVRAKDGVFLFGGRTSQAPPAVEEPPAGEEDLFGQAGGGMGTMAHAFAQAGIV